MVKTNFQISTRLTSDTGFISTKLFSLSVSISCFFCKNHVPEENVKNAQSQHEIQKVKED